MALTNPKIHMKSALMSPEFLNKLRKSLFFIVLLFVLPLILRIGLLFTWPVLVSILFGFLLNMSQPDVKNVDASDNASRDGGSVYLLYFGGFVVFLIPLLDYAYSMTEPRPPMKALISQIGLFVMAAGLLFRYWSIRTLGEFFTSVVTVKEGHKIIQHGPYKFIRHPSYTGAFFMMFGMSMIYRSFFGLLACIVVLIPCYIYRIKVEEETLRKELGEEYEIYMQRTKRLIPFLV